MNQQHDRSDDLKALLDRLVNGKTLRVDQTIEAFELIMTGNATASQMGALLSLIQQRGATPQELLGAARVMRAKVWKVEVPDGLTVVDTCGTGGDQAHTFNISTAAAVVAAAAGRPRGVAVAKHGNRAVTSQSGSSQVLEALGVKIHVSGETLTRCLDEVGLCFCFARAHHPAMKHVAAVRQELGFRTLFNLLGPLTNPAGAKRQVIGVFLPDLTEPLAKVLLELGSEHVMVVHGRLYNEQGQHAGGLDELTTSGTSQISELRDEHVHTYELDPATLGLAIGHPASLRVDSPQESAELIRAVLSGQHGPARDIVCLNAAAALVVGDVADDLSEGLRLATEAIDSKAALGVLDKLVTVTQADPTPVP